MCRKGKGGILRQLARQAARGGVAKSVQSPATADSTPAKQTEDHLRYWTAPFKWGKSRDGPPLERLIPVMSTVSILTVSVFGGAAEAEKLWPEGVALGEWSDVGEPERWEDLWKQRNKRPRDIWVTQGVGEGLPILVPLAQDPRGDRFFMEQLVDTGSRTVEGMAAVNGEMLRRLRGKPDPEKGDLLPFEEAYQNLREATEALRANPNLDFNYEKGNDKLPDEFSAFVGRTGPPPTPRKGNPHDDDLDASQGNGGPSPVGHLWMEHHPACLDSTGHGSGSLLPTVRSREGKMHSTGVLRDLGAQGKCFPTILRSRKGRSSSIDRLSIVRDLPEGAG